MHINWDKYYEVDFGIVLPGTVHNKKFKDPVFAVILKVELYPYYKPLDNPFTVNIDDKDKYSLKIKYIANKTSQLYCVYYHVISKDLDYILCLRGGTEDLTVTIPRKNIELIAYKKGEAKLTRFELKNLSNISATFEFQIDNEQSDFTLSPRLGKLEPCSSLYVFLSYTPHSYGMFYRILCCFVHNHPPLCVEIQLACLKEQNDHQLFTFMEPLPKPDDSFVYIFDSNKLIDYNDPKVPIKPAILDKNYLDLGSKVLSCGDSSVSERFLIRNLSSVDLFIRWNTDKKGIFKITPKSTFIVRGQKLVFEVVFNPTANDNLYSATIDASISWGEKCSYSLPYHLSLHVLGNSFDETSCGWLAQCKIPERVLMPTTLPNKRVWATFIIRKFGHLPVMFRFKPPENTNFSILPKQGIITDDFRIVVVEFSPGVITATTYKEKWIILLNSTNEIELELIGTVENPNVWLPLHDEVVFPPTPLNCTSYSYLEVKNITRHALRYDMDTFGGDLVRLEMNGSCLYPGEQARFRLSYSPISLGEFFTTRYISISSYDSRTQSKYTNKHLIRINGTTVQPRLTSIPSTLYLGDFHKDEVLSNFFNVTNLGECTCYIKFVTLTKDTMKRYKQSHFEPNCIILDPNKERMITIKTSADSSGYHSLKIKAMICKTPNCRSSEQVMGIDLLDIYFFCYSYAFRIVDIVCVNESEQALSKYHLWKIMNIDGWNESIKKSGTYFTEETVVMKVPENVLGEYFFEVGLVFENQNRIPTTISVVKTSPCNCPPYTTKTGYLLERPDEMCPHRSQVWITPFMEEFKPKEKKIMTLTVLYNDPTVSKSYFILTMFSKERPHVKHSIYINVTRHVLAKNKCSADICQYDQPENSSVIPLSNVYIGNPSPPVQAIWFYNNVNEEVPYSITITGEKQEYLNCLNPNGSISSNSLHPVFVIFTPPGPNEYQITLNCDLGIRKRIITLKVKGSVNHSRNPLLEDTRMPSSSILKYSKTYSKVYNPINRLIINGLTTHSTTSRIIQLCNYGQHDMIFKWSSCSFEGLLNIAVTPNEGSIQQKGRQTFKVTIKTFGKPFIASFTLKCKITGNISFFKSVISLRSRQVSKLSPLHDRLALIQKLNSPINDQLRQADLDSDSHYYIHLTVAVNCASQKWLEKIPFGLKKQKLEWIISPTPDIIPQPRTQPLDKCLALVSIQLFKYLMMDILESSRFQDKISEKPLPQYFDELITKAKKAEKKIISLNKESLFRIIEDTFFNLISKEK